MIPATFTITALIFCAILVAAGAPLLSVYIVGGLGLLWQLGAALAAGAVPPPPPAPVISDDPTEGLDLERG